MLDVHSETVETLFCMAVAGASKTDQAKELIKQLSVFDRQELANAVWRLSEWIQEVIEERNSPKPRP